MPPKRAWGAFKERQMSLESVDYLGQTIDSNGVHTSPKKVHAIVDAPPPQNV